MSHVLRRQAALRVSSVLCAGRAASLSASARPIQPWPRQQTTAPRVCAFTTKSAFRADAAEDKTRRGTRKTAPDDHQKVTTAETAQKNVDDRPWQRESSHAQPESTSPDPTGGDQTKGRLLTTPTRLLKLILPMPFYAEQRYINEKDGSEAEINPDETVEPLALLVHPQQPLSYLERLIQAEIPRLRVDGGEKLPDIVFRAEADHGETPERSRTDGSNVASYSGLGREGPSKSNGDANWVRWSSSTEVGDFIRDAARGREFAIAIEGHGAELRVAVPSFKDRTHYQRNRLRRMSRQINDMAHVKRECDLLAHKGAHRLAKGGFGALAAWWVVVYYVSFHTQMGWDVVEPVTYLAGLTTIMGGYLWFLFISKDLSYKAAMNITVSKRQSALYTERGFDQHRWDYLVHEANTLRREIKFVATEYDADWDEMKDLGGEDVKEVLEEEREDRKKGQKGDEEEDDDDDDDREERHKEKNKKDTKSDKSEKD